MTSLAAGTGMVSSTCGMRGHLVEEAQGFKVLIRL